MVDRQDVPDDAEEARRQEVARRYEEEQRGLARLGLSTPICHEIAGAAIEEYRRAPRRGSAGGPGTYAYEGALAEMTVQLEECEYTREDLVNLPMLINDKIKRAVILTSGNRFTGVYGTGISPRTRYKKGGVTHHAIRGNRTMKGQDVIGDVLSFENLPPSVDERFAKVVQRLSDMSVYLYLLHFDFKKMEIRSEFSMPSSRQGSEYLEIFLDRIRVSPYTITGQQDGDGEIDIDFNPEPIE